MNHAFKACLSNVQIRTSILFVTACLAFFASCRQRHSASGVESVKVEYRDIGVQFKIEKITLVTPPSQNDFASPIPQKTQDLEVVVRYERVNNPSKGSNWACTYRDGKKRFPPCESDGLLYLSMKEAELAVGPDNWVEEFKENLRSKEEILGTNPTVRDSICKLNAAFIVKYGIISDPPCKLFYRENAVNQAIEQGN